MKVNTLEDETREDDVTTVVVRPPQVPHLLRVDLTRTKSLVQIPAVTQVAASTLAMHTVLSLKSCKCVC